MLSSSDISEWMKGDANFLGVFALNNLPSVGVPARPKEIKIIVNTDTDNLPGTHWIAVIRHCDGHAEIFDSFGLYPPARIQLWCNKYCTRWTYNTKMIQALDSTLCGAYCCLFLLSREKFSTLDACVGYLSQIV